MHLFFTDDKDEAESTAVVQALEHIDDDCDRYILISHVFYLQSWKLSHNCTV